MDNSEFDSTPPRAKSGKPSDKEKLSGSFLVLDGAMFVCSQGAAPNSIVASGKRKLYAQNQKVVTTDDTTFQTPTLTFGSCRLSTKTNAGQPCEYANGAWDEKSCYNSMVLDTSKMYCSVCAPRGGEISCVFHGQQCLVTMQDLLEYEVDKAFAISSLASIVEFEKPELALQEKAPKKRAREGSVNSIVLKLPAKEGGKEQPVGKRLRLGEKLLLEANTKAKAGLEGIPVSWILFQKEAVEVLDKKGNPQKATRISNLTIFPKVGTPFSLKLKKEGVYHIEAVGTTKDFASLKKYYKAQETLAANGWILKNEKLPLDSGACQTVEVCENSILSVSVENAKRYEMDDFIEWRREGYVMVNQCTPPLRGESGTFAVVSLGSIAIIKIETAHSLLPSEDFDCYINGIYFGMEEMGSFVLYNKKERRYAISVQNTGTYVVRMVLREGSNKELSSQNVKLLCVSDFWNVTVKSGEEKNPMRVRPGSPFVFTVEYDKGGNGSDTVISWRWGKAVKGKKKGEIEKIVEAESAKGNTLLVKSKDEEYDIWFEASANDKDFLYKNAKKYGDDNVWTYICEVRRNKVLKAWFDTDEFFVGIPSLLNLEFLYQDYSARYDGELKCSIDDGDERVLNGRTCSIDFPTVGEHTVAVKMGNTPKVVLNVEVHEITVSRWEFLDSVNCNTTRAAFDTPVTATVSIPAFRHLDKEQREAIRLEVWDERSGEKPFSKPFESARFDDRGLLRAEFHASDLTDARDSMLLQCVLRNLPCSVEGLDETQWPGRFRLANTGKLLVCQSEYVRGFFASNSNNPQKSILRYGAEAKIVLYLYNVERAKIENCSLLLMENDHEGDWREFDTIIWSAALPIPDNTGRIEIPIPSDCIVEADHDPEKMRIPRMFYFIVLYKNPETNEATPFYAYPIQNPKADFEVEVTEEGLRHIDCNYFWQLKYVSEEEGTLNDTLAHFAQVVIGEPLKAGEGRPLAVGACPRCLEEAELMLNRLITIPRFSKDAEAQARLRVICETYTLYAERFYMDTCWMKAHFFAQASVESGELLRGAAENMSYSRDRFESMFSGQIFHTEKKGGKTVIKKDEKGEKMYLDGAKERMDNLFNLTGLEFQKEAARIAYNGKLGNSNKADSDDGWNYRGGGFVQVTGKSNYESVQRTIKSFTGEVVRIKSADQMAADLRLATLTSMAYLAKRKIHLRKVTSNEKGVTGMYFIANGQRNEYFVSKLVGSEHNPTKGKTNYDKKQEFFDEFYNALSVSRCEWNEEFTEEQQLANIYRIDLDQFSAYKYQENRESDDFIYKIYNNGKKVEEYSFKRMEFSFRKGVKFLRFPETGPNWGRYGCRDKNKGKDTNPEDGDNCISEENCACFLGLLYSLPLNGHDETIYYDDITVSFSNGGHSCHQRGNDIDLRYPKGARDARDSWNWTITNVFNGDEDAFIKHLESFLAIAMKWGYTKNCANETIEGAKYCKKHSSHLHLGNRYFERYI